MGLPTYCLPKVFELHYQTNLVLCIAALRTWTLLLYRVSSLCDAKSFWADVGLLFSQDPQRLMSILDMDQNGRISQLGP